MNNLSCPARRVLGRPLQEEPLLLGALRPPSPGLLGRSLTKKNRLGRGSQWLRGLLGPLAEGKRAEGSSVSVGLCEMELNMKDWGGKGP